jgi:hypothetical protein
MLGTIFKGSKYSQECYVELLGMQYSLYKLVKQKGMLAVEEHIENPGSSSLFNAFPTFAAIHHAVEFVCDYMRMLTLGANNVHEIDALMDEELETHHQEQERLVSAMQSIADGTPALAHRRCRARRDQDDGGDQGAAGGARTPDRRRARRHLLRRLRRLRLLRADGGVAQEHLRCGSQILPVAQGRASSHHISGQPR